jgi:hypothetical protein
MKYPKPLIFLTFLSLYFLSCSKSAKVSPVTKTVDTTTTPPVKTPDVFTVSIVSGQNQTDTVGHTLANPILFQAYKNGIICGDCSVEVVGSGCNNDFPETFNTSPNYNQSYSWALSSEPGIQTLKFTVMDANKNRLDSTTVKATALQSSGLGLLSTACSLGGLANKPPIFCKLSSGRILADYYLSPRYSDNNGLTWHPIKSLNGFIITNFTAGPNNQVLASYFNDVYISTIYSADGGMTWRSFNETINGESTLGGYINNGVIYFNNNISLTFSYDNGTTWTQGAGIVPIAIAEQKNGNIFVVDNNYHLYKSTDKGQTFVQVTGANSNLEMYSAIFSICVDDNDNIYIGTSNSNSGIYVSADNAQTFTRIATSPTGSPGKDVAVRMGNKQHDGYYYLAYTGTLYRTKDFVIFQNISTRYNYNMTDCVVADNNALILCGASDRFKYTYAY